MIRISIAVLLGAVAFTASAQLYRWTDDKGRVHITDTPPPASARSVEKKASAAGPGVGGQMPFELAQAIKNYPVTLYTSPSCKQACAAARAALNKRSVPFKEVQVWDEPTNEELKRVAGASEVPALVVGRSVHRGFEQGAYDALLDSARYPRAGLLPPRAQAAPAAPEGYVTPGESRTPVAEPVKPQPPPPPAASGPYAPKPPPPQKQ